MTNNVGSGLNDSFGLICESEGENMKINKYVHQDVVASVLLIAVSLFFLIGSFQYNLQNRMFPMCISIVSLAFSVRTLQVGIRKTKELNYKIANGEDIVPQISMRKLKQPAIGYAIMLLYAVSIGFLGFFASSALFMLVMMLFMGYRKWKVIIPIIIGLEIFIFFFFVRFVGLRLPSGILF